ncbi:hypothetical protein HDV05_002392 [Chytridiales sp. JEL 0842]|nr:hypothetical protein HDV05_002392 [Chytridiales sp. JEL 0842]
MTSDQQPPSSVVYNNFDKVRPDSRHRRAKSDDRPLTSRSRQVKEGMRTAPQFSAENPKSAKGILREALLFVHEREHSKALMKGRDAKNLLMMKEKERSMREKQQQQMQQQQQTRIVEKRRRSTQKGAPLFMHAEDEDLKSEEDRDDDRSDLSGSEEIAEDRGLRNRPSRAAKLVPVLQPPEGNVVSSSRANILEKRKSTFVNPFDHLTTSPTEPTGIPDEGRTRRRSTTDMGAAGLNPEVNRSRRGSVQLVGASGSIVNFNQVPRLSKAQRTTSVGEGTLSEPCTTRGSLMRRASSSSKTGFADNPFAMSQNDIELTLPHSLRTSNASGRRGSTASFSSQGQIDSMIGRRKSSTTETIHVTATSTTRRGSLFANTKRSSAYATQTFVTGLFMEQEKVKYKYGTSPMFFKLQRVFRTIALASHLIKFLSRILKNPIQWGWEHDPDSNLFRNTKLRHVDQKKAISAIDFGVSKLFNTQKVFRGWLPDAMRDMFRKQPHLRTEADITEMQLWCSGMKAFSKYQPHIQRRLLKMGVYERWHSGRVIVKEGHKATNFYILLDGEVEISRIDYAGIAANHNGKNKHLRRNAPSASEGKRDDGNQNEQDLAKASVLELNLTEEEKAEYERAYRIVLGTQTSGDSFGELAFINDGRRVATVSTKRTTEFLVVNREDFEAILSMAQDRDIREKLAIMKEIPLFQTLSATIGQLAHYCEVLSYPPNSMLICEGDVCEYIYFIRSGTCRLIKSVPFVKVPMRRDTFRLEAVPAQDLACLRQKSSLVTKFLIVQQLHPGDFYYDGNTVKTARELILSSGLGSSAARTSVVANLKTQVLRISKMDFNKFATRSTWHMYVETSTNVVPNIEKLSNAFMGKRIWELHKKKVIEEVVRDIRNRRKQGRELTTFL